MFTQQDGRQITPDECFSVFQKETGSLTLLNDCVNCH